MKVTLTVYCASQVLDQYQTKFKPAKLSFLTGVSNAHCKITSPLQLLMAPDSAGH